MFILGIIGKLLKSRKAKIPGRYNLYLCANIIFYAALPEYFIPTLQQLYELFMIYLCAVCIVYFVKCKFPGNLQTCFYKAAVWGRW